MERDGLIERVADPLDKPSRLGSLTAHAPRRLLKGKAIMDATVEIALRGFSTVEIEQLDALMHRMYDNLERAAEEMHL